MTTAQSPPAVLKRQAERIAATLKAVERGDVTLDPNKPIVNAIKIGVAMDDKILQIEMSLATIHNTSEAGLAEYILQQMRDAREPRQ